MNKIKLIHNKEEFLLEINGVKIGFVKSYEIKSDIDKGTYLTVKMSIDIEQSSIDIDNIEVNLR